MRASTSTIQTILEGKGSVVHSLEPDAFVYRAIQLMAEMSIGAVLVMEHGRLAGILSERDYARKVILKSKSSRETRIAEIMSSPVTVITPECTVDEAMSVMTQKRIRHLPVQQGEQVLGVVSIGDLVKAIISDQAETIEHLHAYIAGQYPG
jgi:CBS domain-containing protein